MTQNIANKRKYFEGYPPYERVKRGLAIRAQRELGIVHRTCNVRIPEQKRGRTQALLETFHNATLAAQWVLRDIKNHKPQQRFARFRKKYSSSYNTKSIATLIETLYRTRVNARYHISSHVLSGIWDYLAQHLSAWLQRVTEAQKKGLYKRYAKSATFVIPFGQHTGKTIAEVGRHRIEGYLSLPTRTDCEEAARYLAILINAYPEDTPFRDEAGRYVLSFTDYKDTPLADLSRTTLLYLESLVHRELARMDQIEALKHAVERFLEWTPPGFPTIHSDGLSMNRRQTISFEYEESLSSFGTLLGEPLTEGEQARFGSLQKATYAEIKPRQYIALRWDRADGFVRHRGCGVGYDIKSKKYVFLAYVLYNNSRYKKKLSLENDSQIVDLNNPDVVLRPSRDRVQTMLFNLEMGSHQQRMLEQARRETPQWKAYEQQKPKKKKKTDPETQQSAENPEKPTAPTMAGCIRAARMTVHYDEDRQKEWFSVSIVVGTRQQRIKTPDHVIGVHVDPQFGLAAMVCTLRGTLVAYCVLDEPTLAQLLRNMPLEGQRDPMSRTPQEYHHRVATALAGLAKHYCGQIGIENIDYLRAMAGRSPIMGRNGSESIKTIGALLNYKLALNDLPQALDIRGVAPKRDCAQCGKRHAQPVIDAEEDFDCVFCGHRESRRANTAREVARRVLWSIGRTPPKKAKPTP